jgi:hypothetical protein
MRHWTAVALLLAAPASAQDELFRYRADAEPRWISPENPTGAKGAGARENRGAKGHAFETIPVGGSHVLADIRGAGTIDRMWMTIEDRSPEALRGLRLDIFWDGAATPAVSAPLGDFFLTARRDAADGNRLAGEPGRALVRVHHSDAVPPRCTDRGGERIRQAGQSHLLRHQLSRGEAAAPGCALLPRLVEPRTGDAARPGLSHPARIRGRGRFLGTSVTVLTNPVYEKTWWGEGEVKIALDGDRSDAPTLVGTGTEDYIGTAWGQGAYIHRYQGAPIASWDVEGRWTFYRFHLPDPIFFKSDIEVALQQMGGARKNIVLGLQKKGAPMIPVTIDPGSRNNFQKLLESGKPLSDPSLPDGHTNYYRSDDVAAVAYFYLDRPEAALPPIAPAAERMAGIRLPPKKP